MSRDKRALLDILAGASWFCITAYIGLRIADPKFFVSPYLLNPLVNPKFIANIHELARLSAKSDYPWPPGVQWLSKTPISFTMQNFFIFGVGPVLSVLMMFGLRFAWRIHQRAILGFCVIGACIVLWQGVQFLQTMRYLLPLYPLAACLAALGLVNCCFNARAALGLAALLVAWPFAFMHIYADDHTRVRASRWMYENLPDNTNIAVEHWDDSLPLGLPNQSKHFTFVETPVFEPDTSEKWQRLSEAWNKSEYLVLSSNRGWGSMMPLKFKYPRMSRWYEDLFAGRTQWRMVHHEASFPSLFGIELSTRSADEALSVYDHPEVYIFAKEAKAG